ncbi:MAG: helix-turn-helix domain-containing protein [Rikenellaceae bacterium]
MMLRHLKIFTLLLLVLFVTGCDRGRSERFVIGVSQSVSDDWHSLLCREIIREAELYGDLEVRCSVAKGSLERQISQIEEFVKRGVDMIIVTPVSSTGVVDVVERAVDSGVKVLVVDNPIESERCSGYFGVDQGRLGQIISMRLSERRVPTKLFELFDVRNPERSQRVHERMNIAMRRMPQVESVGSVVTPRDSAVLLSLVDSLVGLYSGELLLLCHNANWAAVVNSGAEKLGNRDRFEIWSMAANQGKSGAVELVYNRVANLMFQYPTSGDLLVEQAYKILKGEEFVKQRYLSTPVVDESSVKYFRKQLFSNHKYNGKIKSLNELNSRMAMESRRSSHRLYLLFGVLVVAVGLSVGLIVWLLRRRVQRAEAADTLQVTTVVDGVTNGVTNGVMEGLTAGSTVGLPPQEQRFIDKFYEVIDRNLGNDKFEIESIGDELHYSRVQVYRKVKAITGESPVKILRNRRLMRADQLLKRTDKSIAEIAFEVGFTTPSYFSRNYKDLFGVLPSAVKR